MGVWLYPTVRLDKGCVTSVIAGQKNTWLSVQKILGERHKALQPFLSVPPCL